MTSHICHSHEYARGVFTRDEVFSVRSHPDSSVRVHKLKQAKDSVEESASYGILCSHYFPFGMFLLSPALSRSLRASHHCGRKQCPS